MADHRQMVCKRRTRKSNCSCLVGVFDHRYHGGDARPTADEAHDARYHAMAGRLQFLPLPCQDGMEPPSLQGADEDDGDP